VSSPSRSHRRRGREVRRVAFLAIAGVALLVLPSAQVSSALAGDSIATVAVFPVENLSGGTIPADQVRQFLAGRLSSGGIRLLGDDALEAFMVRHRVRYAAGIDSATAEALRQETGVEGIVIASFELSSDALPPKVALIARLISITAVPAVVWAEDAGMAGDDGPGLFELGIVNDYQVLLTRALDRLSDSLLRYLVSGETRARSKPASKFEPRTSFRGVTLEAGRQYSVAVVPFVNLSERRNAGDVLALLFMRHLASAAQFRVVDTGVVRRQLLDARIIMDGGLSLSDADTVAALIEADYVLGGRVLRYEDYDGAGGRTRVEFSAVLIEKKTRKVVWSSDSYNDGSDGVHFFERGTSRTAHAMATQMVRLTTEMIAGRSR
jgi:TolB-like protein